MEATDRDAEILAALDSGMSYAAVATRMSISTATVHKAVKRSGRPTKTRPKWTQADDTLLVKRFEAGDTHDQIAAVMGLGPTTIGSRLKLLGYSREPQRRTIHGRPVCWRSGCQHTVCLAAKAEYKRAEKEMEKSRGPVTHGLAGYGRNCRCDICETAMVEALRARQKRTRKTAISHREPWTTSDDDAAMDMSRRIEDIAHELGRTYSAVDNRRRLLLKRAQVLTLNDETPPRTRRGEPEGAMGNWFYW